jgi:universal stress protein E
MTKRIERILIAVKPWQDRLPISNSRATLLARGLGAELALTSCIRLSAAAVELNWMDAAQSMDFDIARLDRVDDELAILERLADPLRAEGVSVSTRVTSDGSAGRGVLDQVDAWEADLLIARVHERGVIPHPRLMDIDRQLIRLCPCPLLLGHGPDDGAYRSILAAVDPLHDHAEPTGLDHEIVGAARQFRDVFNAQLQILNVCPDPNEFDVVSSVEVRPGVFYGSENIEAVHRQAIIDLADDCGVSDAETLVQIGKPAEGIAEVARQRQADLIALGSIRRSRLHDLLLGSTAEIIVDEAESDVLLLKPQ